MSKFIYQNVLIHIDIYFFFYRVIHGDWQAHCICHSLIYLNPLHVKDVLALHDSRVQRCSLDGEKRFLYVLYARINTSNKNW